jgi:hypothetical protein
VPIWDDKNTESISNLGLQSFHILLFLQWRKEDDEEEKKKKTVNTIWTWNISIPK